MTKEEYWEKVFYYHLLGAGKEDGFDVEHGGFIVQMRHQLWKKEAFEEFIVDFEKFTNSSPEDLENFDYLKNNLLTSLLVCILHNHKMMSYKSAEDCMPDQDMGRLFSEIMKLFPSNNRKHKEKERVKREDIRWEDVDN